MATPLTPAKKHLIQLYRNAIARCYFDEETLESVQSDRRRVSPAVPPFVQQSQMRSVPHVFFDVRTRRRTLISIGSAAAELITLLQGIATISFSDARHGSRRWQIQRAVTTDVYVGVHGAGMSNVAVLARDSVVVEIAPLPWHCASRTGSDDYSHCWFGKYSAAIGNRHISVVWSTIHDREHIVATGKELFNLVMLGLCAFNASLCRQ
jgi:hypothetical protein